MVKGLGTIRGSFKGSIRVLEGYDKGLGVTFNFFGFIESYHN